MSKDYMLRNSPHITNISLSVNNIAQRLAAMPYFDVICTEMITEIIGDAVNIINIIHCQVSLGPALVLSNKVITKVNQQDRWIVE